MRPAANGPAIGIGNLADNRYMTNGRQKKRPQTPLERMTDLTRRIVAVPKSEIGKQKPKRRKKS